MVLVVLYCVKLTKDLYFQTHFPVWFQVRVGQKRSLHEVCETEVQQQPFYMLMVSIAYQALAACSELLADLLGAEQQPESKLPKLPLDLLLQFS